MCAAAPRRCQGGSTRAATPPRAGASQASATPAMEEVSRPRPSGPGGGGGRSARIERPPPPSPPLTAGWSGLQRRRGGPASSTTRWCCLRHLAASTRRGPTAAAATSRASPGAPTPPATRPPPLFLHYLAVFKHSITGRRFRPLPCGSFQFPCQPPYQSHWMAMESLLAALFLSSLVAVASQPSPTTWINSD
jgi:hypothetical protein